MAFDLAHEEGLICRNIGDTLAVCPPMIITESQVDELVTRLGRTLDRARDWAQRNGVAAA